MKRKLIRRASSIVMATIVAVAAMAAPPRPNAIAQFDNYVFFNDVNALHLKAAAEVGIKGVDLRANVADALYGLVTIANSDNYKLANLTHSVPYLTPAAADLLNTIAVNFTDSLPQKGLPRYRVIVTSVLRTGEDVRRLVKVNRNASHNSAHCHATTFDIAYKTFDKLDTDKPDVPARTLEMVLAEVLRDLRSQGLCYVKYERGQCCFHITCRYSFNDIF